jgi:hypothetical protein
MHDFKAVDIIILGVGVRFIMNKFSDWPSLSVSICLDKENAARVQVC